MTEQEEKDEAFAKMIGECLVGATVLVGLVGIVVLVIMCLD